MLEIAFAVIEVCIVELLTKFDSAETRLLPFVNSTMMDCIHSPPPRCAQIFLDIHCGNFEYISHLKIM